MRRLRVLIADSDPGIIKLLQAAFRARDYETLVAMDGAEVLHKIQGELLDIVLMDTTMPKMDGCEVCRHLREWSQIPVIMLSSRDAAEEKVRCLDVGADDYVTKPFNLDELMARARAVIRRAQVVSTTPTQPLFIVGDLEINFVERRVTHAGNEVICTPTEYSLLQELVLNVGKVVTHAQLLNKVWGPGYRDEKEYLHVFVNRLRAKLEPDSANPRYILTVPGVGYMFNRRRLNQTSI